MPTISVVTVSFNQGHFLERCIASVREQGFDSYEHIVVDAGSTDNSRQLISADSRLADRAILEPDAGPADGLNKGFNAANGEILLYLNADDELAPDSLRAIADLHARFDSADFLLGAGWIIDESGRPVKHIMAPRFSLTRYAMGVGRILQQSTSFKLRAWRGGLRFNVENRTCWDGEFYVDAALSGASMMTTRKDLGYFRIYADSITGSQRFAHQYEEDQKRIKDKITRNRLVRSRAAHLGARAANAPWSAVDRLATKNSFPGLVGTPSAS